MQPDHKNGGGKVLRHRAAVRFQHWAIALSGIVLLLSGFGQFPLYKRYMVDRVAGLGWVSDFGLQFDIHMVAAALFTAAVSFHIFYHLLRGDRGLLPRRGDLGESWQIVKATFGRGEEPPSGKYLAEQRVVYALFGGTMILLIVTGLLKAAQGLPGVTFGSPVQMWMTMLHNLGTVLFLLIFAAHIFALVLNSNRPLLPSMFTGRVSGEYARHRHPLWNAAPRALPPPPADPSVETVLEKAS